MYYRRFRNIEVGETFFLDGKECVKTSDTSCTRTINIQENQKVQSEEPTMFSQLVPGDYFGYAGARYIKVNSCRSNGRSEAFCIDENRFTDLGNNCPVDLL